MTETRKNAKHELIKYIERNNGVSFAEIEHVFDSIGYDYKGDICSSPAQYPHIIYWFGWNDDAFDLLDEVKKEKNLQFEPAQQFIYLMDGKCLNLPIVKKLYQYKTDHWLPVVVTAKKRGLIK